MILSYSIDFSALEKCVKRLNPKVALITFAPGLFGARAQVVEALERLGVKPIVSAIPSYGTCDLHLSEMSAVQADVVINIGHHWQGPEIGRVCFVNVEFMFNVANETSALLEGLRGLNISRVAVLTISSYMSLTKELVKALEESGISVARPRGIAGHWEYEVLGCNYLPAYTTGPVDAQVFIGNSRFHAIGLYLSTERKTLMFDPESMSLLDIKDEAEKALRASLLRISVASTKNKFGIVLGLKEGQLNPEKTRLLSERLIAHGKNVQLISALELTPESLDRFPDIEAFVETACPRIPMTDTGFRRPVLSYPEGLGLLRLLNGKDVGNPYRMAVMY